MCYWIWDKGNPTEAREISKVRELMMMWDRVKSNWVKHVSQELTYNSSLVSTFCFCPQHLHHATDLPLFNWICLKPDSPQLSRVHLFPSMRMSISAKRKQAEHQPTKNCCANRNVKVVEGCEEPAFYSPSLSCCSWSHLLDAHHNGSPPKHLVSSSAWISVKKQTDKNATPNKFTSSGVASCRELSAKQSLN